MRTLAMVLMTALLTACAPGSAESPRHFAAAAHGSTAREVSGSAPVNEADSARTTCERPRTFLKTSDHTVFIPSSLDQRRRVTVHVGEVIHLLATGNCARSVAASPQNSRLRVLWHLSGGVGPTSFKAVRPGVVRLVVSMPMCALPPNSTAPRCLGGVQAMGTALVTVRPSGF
jgi:hypothetical protein